jgi:hypothetical protein|tara:strand:+ start:345 stop:497 length:153 start_codon:yes stop_codon:yes gene_type:complete
MRLIFKLLLGAGSKEDFNPTPLNLFTTAIILLVAFLGLVIGLIYIILQII